MAVASAKHTDAGTTGPDRSIPEELIALATLGIRSGAHEVTISHSGLGFEFKAPIGWILRIRRFDRHFRNIDAEGDRFSFEHQIGCDIAEAKAPDWLLEQAAAETPTPAVIEDYVELFATGLRNGWDMLYSREMADHAIWQGFCEQQGIPDALGMRHRLRGYAFAHRSRSGKSVEITLSRHELNDEESVYEIVSSGERHGVRDRARAEQLLTTTAPGYTPVAYFDDTREEWVK